MNLKEEIRYECIVESEEKDERNLPTLTFNSGNGCIKYKKSLSNKKSCQTTNCSEAVFTLLNMYVFDFCLPTCSINVIPI